MFYTRLTSLCAERGVKITNVVSELKMGSGNLSNWKSGRMPRGESLSKLADYFGVSTDYLLGRTDSKEPPEASGGPLRAELLDNFGRLNQEGQERLVETSDDMVSSGKYKNPDAVPADQPADSDLQLVAARDGSRTEIEVSSEICFSEENAGLPE